MTGFVRRAVLAVAWLGIMAVISIGAAGLVAAMAHQPGTPSRAELTLSGDSAAAPELAAVQTGLVSMTADVKKLGELGRGSLAALVASESATLDATVAEGEALAKSIEDQSAALRAKLAALPGSGPQEALVLSADTRARRDVATQALDSTAGLRALWARLGIGSATATRVSTLLTQHDQVAGHAFDLGRKARYADALKGLDQADAIVVEARRLRDGLRNTVDVSTLTQWLDRNAEYDAALRRLYVATVAGKGKVTNEMKAAFNAERKAHDLLPANTSGIVIILAEIGRGGLNQAVIGIEEAEGDLQAAVDQLTAAPAPSEPEPSEPEPSEPEPSAPEPSAPEPSDATASPAP